MDLRPVTDDDLDQYFDVRSQAFGVPEGEREEWRSFVAGGTDVRRIGAFRSGRLLGAMSVIPAGQYVLGRSVPMGAIAGVVVRPEVRGTGVARTMLGEAVRGMRADGIHVSSLHPASTRAYRSAGWEIAGDAGWVSVTTRSLSAIRGDADGVVEVLTGADADAVRACYAAFAPTVHGAVDRSPSFWRFHDRSAAAAGAYLYGVRRGGGLAGYVAYTQTTRAPDWGYSLQIDDFVATDRDTAVALWRFIGGNSMQVERVVMTFAVLRGLLLLLDEQDAMLRDENRWMHRIVDLPGAMGARGYPAGLTGSVDVTVTDPLDAVAGTWTIRVADGAGEAVPGPSPAAVTIDVGALSALAIGWTTVDALATAGRVTGPSDALARLGALLLAPTPTMTDFF